MVIQTDMLSCIRDVSLPNQWLPSLLNNALDSLLYSNPSPPAAYSGSSSQELLGGVQQIYCGNGIVYALVTYRLEISLVGKSYWGQGSPGEIQAPTPNPWRYWELSRASTFGEMGMQDNFMRILQVPSTQVSQRLGGYLGGSCLSYGISYIKYVFALKLRLF